MTVHRHDADARAKLRAMSNEELLALVKDCGCHDGLCALAQELADRLRALQRLREAAGRIH